MSRKSDITPINNETLDRRVKLTQVDKENIIQMYATGTFSQRSLASEFNVSRRSIQFVLSPEKLEENLMRREERGGWKTYYNKEKHRVSMKEHRDYKKELFSEGKI